MAVHGYTLFFFVGLIVLANDVSAAVTAETFALGRVPKMALLA